MGLLSFHCPQEPQSHQVNIQAIKLRPELREPVDWTSPIAKQLVVLAFTLWFRSLVLGKDLVLKNV